MTFVVIDFETTGLDYKTEQVIEIGAIKYDAEYTEVGRLHTMVVLNKGRELSNFITKLTGIKKEDTEKGVFEVVGLNMLKDFIGDAVVVAQHAPFDLAYLSQALEPKVFIDTRSLSRLLNPQKKAGLKDICQRYGVSLEGHHRSINDCEATAKVMEIMVKEAEEKGIDYHNIVVEAPDRKLNFVPKHSHVINLKTIKAGHEIKVK